MPTEQRSHVVAIDQGTTSTRAIVFDHGGQVVAVDQMEHRQIFPQPGWVEHDANEIWSTQSGVMQEALSSAGIRAGDVARAEASEPTTSSSGGPGT